jgi:glutaryl-CoA dehydrogenase
MLTTCRKNADEWVLNGRKKWIGNSTFSDINVIWARDEASGQVKGFLVEKDNPGFSEDRPQDPGGPGAPAAGREPQY